MLKKSFITTVIVALFATMGTLNAQEKYAIISARKKTHNTLFINNLVLINSLNKKEVLFGQ